MRVGPAVLALAAALSTAPTASAAPPLGYAGTATTPPSGPERSDAARRAEPGYTTGTSTSALELGADPVSEEDLALLAALDTHTGTTSTSARQLEPGWWLTPAPLSRPSILVSKEHLREPVGRTLVEALEEQPTVLDASRRYIPGDTLILRGQTGHRIAVSMDGIPLEHTLFRSRDLAWLSVIDPWLVDEVALDRPTPLYASIHGGAASLALEGLEPRRERGASADAEVEARTADRSTATHLSLDSSLGWLAIRASGGYADFRATRVATSSIGEDRGGAFQRFSGAVRARILGRPGDPVAIHAGLDLDRLLNVVRPDLGLPVRVDLARERTLFFARAEVGGDGAGASMTIAYQTFMLASAAQLGRVDPRTTRADATTARLGGHVAIGRHVVATAGGSFESSGGRVTVPTTEDLGDTRCLAGFVAAELATDEVSAHVVASVADVRTHARLLAVGGEVDASETRVLTQGATRVRVFGPLGLRAGWSQALYVPTVADLVAAGGPLRPEHALSFEAGPSFHRREAFLELVGVYGRLDDAVEPVSIFSERLVNVPRVELAGLELTGGVLVAERLRIAGALTWTEARDAASSAAVLTFPTLTGRASVRWDLRARGAFLEVHLRGTSPPVYVASLEGGEPPASLSGVAPSSSVRVGVRGGIELGLGLHLALALENALDTPFRAPTSLVPGAGVDVRAALSWSGAWR